MNCQEAASLLKKNIEQIMVGSEQSCGLIMILTTYQLTKSSS